MSVAHNKKRKRARRAESPAIKGVRRLIKQGKMPRFVLARDEKGKLEPTNRIKVVSYDKDTDEVKYTKHGYTLRQVGTIELLKKD